MSINNIPTDSIDPTDPINPIDPTYPIDPSNNPADFMEPMDPTDPPINPIFTDFMNSNLSTDPNLPKPTTYCGTIAIIGRPNVGKSTLLNRLLGQKISITCRKPQTTRHQILGIKTVGNIQSLYVDTPGMHKTSTRAINKYMNRAAKSVMFDVDVVLFLIDSDKWTPEEDFILTQIQQLTGPVILVINKSDTVRHKTELLPWIEKLSKKHNFAAIVPISAKHGHHVENLEKVIHGYLPEAPFEFPENQVTNKSLSFLSSEIIREKLMRALGDELPYDITVEIEHIKDELGTMFDIAAIIYIERPSQKPIIIGKQGEKLKEIGRQSRMDLEALFKRKVFLRLWVKVKSGWADDDKLLQSLGYD